MSKHALMALLWMPPFVIAQAPEPTSSDSLSALVEAYYSINIDIFQAGSTLGDIDRLFALFTEDFVYVHPKYGGTYSREDLYSGYVNNQANGRYNGSVLDIEVLNRIVGLDAVVTQKRFINKEGPGEVEMTLFEIQGGKIARIVEYW